MNISSSVSAVSRNAVLNVFPIIDLSYWMLRPPGGCRWGGFGKNGFRSGIPPLPRGYCNLHVGGSLRRNLRAAIGYGQNIENTLVRGARAPVSGAGTPFGMMDFLAVEGKVRCHWIVAQFDANGRVGF